jgi:hypothetical protein
MLTSCACSYQPSHAGKDFGSFKVKGGHLAKYLSGAIGGRSHCADAAFLAPSLSTIANNSHLHRSGRIPPLALALE